MRHKGWHEAARRQWSMKRLRDDDLTRVSSWRERRLLLSHAIGQAADAANGGNQRSCQQVSQNGNAVLK